MALCNRARGFAGYAEALEDANERALFLRVAHKEASAAIAPTAVYTHAHDESTRKMAEGLKVMIESVMDVKGIAGINSLESQDTSLTKEEQDYRQWCMTKCLYLNPLNDLGHYSVAATDSLVLATHAVQDDSPFRFESFFDQIKQEYASARWMLYDGLSAKTPHYSDRDVLLHVTDPRPVLSLAIEKAKVAFRVSYSIFDKVGFFLNAYMGLGIPENKVFFRSLWRSGKGQQIRKEFDQIANWAFCALYWLSKDFFEPEMDEVAEPQALDLSDIRNYLEHKYLRVTADEPESCPPDDLAFTLSREQFEAKALHLLRLARSAIIYLSIGIGMEERRREPNRTGVSPEEVLVTTYLPDTEKV
jgi:hypothetical protein